MQNGDKEPGTFEEYVRPHAIVSACFGVGFGIMCGCSERAAETSPLFATSMFGLLVCLITFGTHAEGVSKKLTVWISTKLAIVAGTVFSTVFLVFELCTMFGLGCLR